MKIQEHYNKTEEIINKFKSGKDKYKKSALFNRVVQMLVRDCTEIEVIEQLINITEDTQKAFEQFIIRDTRPIGMTIGS